jgi:AcrR family transcriptional regulator
MKSKSKGELDTSTEEKIKAAARKLFTQKGYAATRTRDIATEAGINLALLNYYFRSKEKLFELVMMENMQHFMVSLTSIINDEKTTLEQKIETVVSNYIDMLTQQPDLPLFILSEIKANPERLIMKMGVKEVLFKSVLFKQLQEAISKGKVVPIHPLQFLMNLLGLSVFPFVASPLLQKVGDLKPKDFAALMQERKKMIPKWIKGMLKTK